MYRSTCPDNPISEYIDEHEYLCDCDMSNYGDHTDDCAYTKWLAEFGEYMDESKYTERQKRQFTENWLNMNDNQRKR